MRKRTAKPPDSRTRVSAYRAPRAAIDLPAIAALIEAGGDITVGRLAEIPCAATAADSDQCLAMLVQRDGESLPQLLLRLDAAIAAFDEDGPIDEVNPASPSAKPKRRPSSRR
jgi:hypothetical protein